KSSGCPTPVNRDHGAGDESRLPGAEVKREAGDLLGLAEPADGLAKVQLGADSFLLMLVIFFEVSFHEGRVHSAWTNAVGADLRWILDSDLPRHRDYCALGSAVGEALFDPNHARHRSDIHDGAGGSQ